ncbi:predicted protein [Chaetoceros tenuissimus]|uniref:EF-hand domain-containing protein n=1 Tax=Chaetoceros tenuissimus TaxID=426638 RepID=A0AAD3HFP7_9STRA|nr:predicted protein [Chaetoceros tenuissimus]
MSSKHRSFRMEREKLFLGEEVDADEKLDVYQLQNLFQGYGYSFPIISVIAIFTWAAQQEKGTCEEKLSLKQIDMFFQRDLKHIARTEGIPSYFARMNNSMKTYFDVVRLMFRLGYNWLFIDTTLYVIAGLLLTVAILIPESSLVYYPHRANMDLLASFSYIFCSGRFVVMFPFHEFRARVNSEKRVDGLKLDLLRRAHIHKHEKKASDVSLRESNFVVGESNTSIVDILSYIEEVLYSNDVNLQLTKLDLEMLVFRYLKQNYAERVTEDILAAIDVSRDRKIGVEEMHRFLCSNGNASTNRFRWLYHVHSSLKAWVNKSVIFSLSFALGSLTSILKNLSLRKNGFDLKWLYGDKNPSYYSGWLIMIGCSFFVLNAYHTIQTSYEREVNAKEVLKNCIVYGALQKSGTYHRSSIKLLEISKNDGKFQRKDLRDLFMSSGIMMQEEDVDAIFDTIDSDRSGNITKDEIDAFLSADENRDIEILKRCFHDFSFWAQFAWFLGTFGYLIPAYEGVQYHQAYFIVGGIGYLIGGLGSLGTLYQAIQNTNKTIIQMKMCVSNMVNGRIDIQLISPHMHRFKDDIFKASTYEKT